MISFYLVKVFVFYNHNKCNKKNSLLDFKKKTTGHLNKCYKDCIREFGTLEDENPVHLSLYCHTIIKSGILSELTTRSCHYCLVKYFCALKYF